MADQIHLLIGQLAEWRNRIEAHFGRQKWSYIFAAFVWALVWYSTMDVLTYLQPLRQFPFDIMPIIAGVPIIAVGWRAVALGNRLGLAVKDFDDGAAFVLPAGQPGAKRTFLGDIKRTIDRYSKLVSATIFTISLVGVILLTTANGLSDNPFIGLLLLIGVPLIALPIGALLGQLVGYAQFWRTMDRNGIALAGLSTPQARTALHGLESLHVFAVIALSVLCFWFAGWSVVWGLGYSQEYESVWRTQFLILWIVSISLFVAAGVRPAWNFRRRVALLSGGHEGRRARDEMVRQALQDLQSWRDPSAKASRQQRERIAELQRFIANLKDQRIESRLLDPRLLVFLLALNVLLLVMSFLTSATPPPVAAF
ncbi:hypothetical protein LB553_21160 [Mesorhizobium sp. CA8]|uniref:hypothetical protein n=1 Tax=Mesorhizobium sp. CA8 TaxID=2876637 RepID=UPI001CCA47D4|nr:hypothetical protein [Mesorhizobium sp. CA8]MBZ9763372.1 hypothetical protein [Mesorhizobium sp. CA8]